MTHCSSTILFYAPLSNQEHHNVSGDKIIANQFIILFESLGYHVLMPSTFSSRELKGLAHVQKTIIDAAEAEIIRVEYLLECSKPLFWVTYHHYHKAPDLLGPVLAEKLNIPYILIEASLNPAERHGNWSIFYPYVEKAIQKANLILSLNLKDEKVLKTHGFEDKSILFPLMIHSQYMQKIDKQAVRQKLAARYLLDIEKPWILVIAQMRAHKKYDSYVYLKETLALVEDQDYELLIIGSGEKEIDIRVHFHSIKQTHFLGFVEPFELPIYYAASDIFAWPGLKEAMGMVYLEAQSMNLPIIMDHQSGGRYFIETNETGFIAKNKQEYAYYLEVLLKDIILRKRMGSNAAAFVLKNYSIDIAKQKMKEVLNNIIPFSKLNE